MRGVLAETKKEKGSRWGTFFRDVYLMLALYFTSSKTARIDNQ